jgi:hypothetical protein
MSTPVCRVLVTGSRSTNEEQARIVRATLAHFWLAHVEHDLIIVEGACPYGGVDLVAYDWAVETPGCTPERHPASGPGDYLARNSRMVDAGADLCLAFPARQKCAARTGGTWDTIGKAAAAGIPVRVLAI